MGKDFRLFGYLNFKTSYKTSIYFQDRAIYSFYDNLRNIRQVDTYRKRTGPDTTQMFVSGIFYTTCMRTEGLRPVTVLRVH